MEPIRVLQVVTHMNRGGLESMLMNYYRNIDHSRVQFDFLTHRSEKKDFDDEILALGGKVYNLPTLNPLSPGYKIALNKFFSEHSEYKIVHSHIDCMSAVVLACAKKHKVPVRIAHSHSASLENNSIKYIKQYYKKKIPKYATELIACSRAAGEFMYGEKKFSIINNAIDLSRFAFNAEAYEKIRDEFGIEKNIVIGHVGNFTYPKNHQFILSVFGEFLKLEPRARLMLVGNNCERADVLERINNDFTQGSVILTGVRSDIPSLMSAFDAFLFPSIYEGLPVTVIEAQASGLPCLISDAITDEVAITPLVKRLSLTQSAQEWAKELQKSTHSKRMNFQDDIVSAGYDIISEAKALEAFYISRQGDR